VSAFCFDIFRDLYNGENMVVAPLPTYMQLAMMRYDSSGETREQLEALLRMNAETGDAQLRGLLDKIVYDDGKGSYTKIANSLWFKGNTRSPQFLANAIGYYDAEIFACKEMNDDTCAELNNWVASKTDNLIPKLLDKFPLNATKNLTATLTAAAKWGGDATESQGIFYSLNGSENNVTYLKTPSSGWGIDSVLYQLAVRPMGNCTLYLIEPKEGTSMDTVIDLLSYTFMSDPRLYGGSYYAKCYITLPQFCSEYRTDLSESLKKMGATAMFDPGKNAEYVSDVISQAVFEITKEGVHGAAASSITNAVRDPQSETMYMKADRPFIYILADSDTNIPLFIGVQTDMG
jgi:serine protease inhibitor